MNIKDQFNPNLSNLRSYTPAKTRRQIASELSMNSKDILKLDSGENTYAPVAIDFASLDPTLWTEYPDGDCSRLKVKLAQYAGVFPTQLVVGNGSDELIDLCCRLFLSYGDVILDTPPTFAMYRFFGQVAGATILDVPRTTGFALDLPALKEKLGTAKLLFLANPNNPTGTLIPTEQIEELLKFGKPVVIDEAYFEFSKQTVLPLLGKYENLIVLRTLSKWAGIAGLRIGYLLASPKICLAIQSIKAPYSVSALSEEIALQVLEQTDRLQVQVEDLITVRDSLYEKLLTMPGICVFPSAASCFVIQFTQKDSIKVAQEFKKRGIIVKVLRSVNLKNAIRVSLAPQQKMERFMNVLEEVLNSKEQDVKIAERKL